MSILFTFYYLQTYSTTHQTPDSAATATAFLTGQKTTQGTLGVGQGTPRGNCAESKKHPLKSILKHSQDKSKNLLKSILKLKYSQNKSTPSNLYIVVLKRHY